MEVLTLSFKVFKLNQLWYNKLNTVDYSDSLLCFHVHMYIILRREQVILSMLIAVLTRNSSMRHNAG